MTTNCEATFNKLVVNPKKDAKSFFWNSFGLLCNRAVDGRDSQCSETTQLGWYCIVRIEAKHDEWSWSQISDFRDSCLRSNSWSIPETFGSSPGYLGRTWRLPYSSSPAWLRSMVLSRMLTRQNLLSKVTTAVNQFEKKRNMNWTVDETSVENVPWSWNTTV